MTTTNMARLQDSVRLNVPGALDGIIRLSMYDVLKEFFQRSNAWLMELPVHVSPPFNDYQLSTGQNVVVNRLMALGRPDTPTTAGLNYAPMSPPQYISATEEGTTNEGQNPLFRTSRQGVLLNAGSKSPILRILQNPNEAEVWIATVALTPCDPTDQDGFVEPPDWVLEKYMRAITSGVASAMMLQPGKSYSSVQGAQFHGRKFNEGIGLARTEVMNMFTFGGQHWRFPGGWNTPRPRLPTSGTLG